jgi:hypothetical protein
MRNALTVAIAVTACMVTGASAQTRPDFSGRWTSDVEPAPEAARDANPAGRRGVANPAGARGNGGRGVVADMGSGWGSTITVTHDASRLRVEYMFFTRGDMQPPLRFDYALDGSESKNTVMMGRGIQEQRSTASWQGDRLVIVTRHPFVNPENGQTMTMAVTRTLSLESPATLVVETVRSGVLGGPATTSRTVYRRLEGGD